MTPFSLLASLAGLSYREAADLLGVRLDTAKSWASGRNPCRAAVLDELRKMIATQERAAVGVRDFLAEQQPEAIELGYPADDAEARALGWPCVGAWAAMAARVIAASDLPVRLVPRGATAASQALACGRADDL